MSPLVLVVDDEPMVREVVARYLALDGFDVHELGDGSAAATWLRGHRPDLVVLDVMLPELDGFSLLRQLRESGNVPVILLTARADEVDRVVGLELGADDYVVKPFSPRELVARVRSVLRRTAAPAIPGNGPPGLTAPLLEFDGLTIDLGSREVTVQQRLVPLTVKEFDLLVALASAPRQVLSRGQLLDQVWDSSESFQDPATVTVHVGRLRQKLEPDPTHPQRITTVRGIGYRFEP